MRVEILRQNISHSNRHGSFQPLCAAWQADGAGLTFLAFEGRRDCLDLGHVHYFWSQTLSAVDAFLLQTQRDTNSNAENSKT